MLKWRTHTKTVAVATKAEAKALLPRFIADTRDGVFRREREAAEARAAQPTLEAWCKTFMAQHVSQDPDRLATRSAYANALRLYILPTLGQHRLHEITGPMIRQTMQDHYRAGRAISTLRLAYAVLHRAFEAAIEDNYTTSNPMPKFASLKLGEGVSGADTARKSALTGREVSALLDACGDPDLRLYVAILAGCGLRPGEALGLRWCDLDVEKRELHVRGSAKKGFARPGEVREVWIGKPKTASSTRTLAMGPALVSMFVAERERQEAYQRILLGRDPNVRELKSLLPADACVFPGDLAVPSRLGQPVDPDAMRSRFMRAAARARLKTTPHALRHTHISHAIEGGLSLADAAARAGHSSVMTTARTYVHSVSESQRKAALIGDSLLVVGLAP
jgi:integrase